MTKSQEKLRAMVVEKAFAEAAIAHAKLELTESHEKLQNAREYYQQIQAQIDTLRVEVLSDKSAPADKDGPLVTDRAMLTYIENNLGFDTTKIREMILEDLPNLNAEVHDNVILAIK